MCNPIYFRCRWCGEVNVKSGVAEDDLWCEICNRELQSDPGDAVEAAAVVEDR